MQKYRVKKDYEEVLNFNDFNIISKLPKNKKKQRKLIIQAKS